MVAIDPLSVDPAPRADRRAGPVAVGSLVVGSSLIGGTAAAAVAWWFGVDHGVGLPGGPVAAVAQLAGLIASVLVCLQLVLIARVPWLTRLLGLGTLVRWHRRVGTGVLILIMIHVVCALLVAALADLGGSWWQLLAVLDAPDLLAALIGTTLIIVAGVTSARLARRRLRHEIWYALHVSVYVGIFLSFAHQVNSGVHFVDRDGMRDAWLILYAGTVAVVLHGRLVGATAGLLRQPVRVERVVPETDRIASVWLAGPGLWQVRARPGQFFYVRFLAPGHLWTAHPYSVSWRPEWGRMRLTIGSSGDHSSATRWLRPGTRVLLQGPFGAFGVSSAPGCPVLLVAGGSGIGPVAAVAREFCRRGRDVVLLHRGSAIDQLALQAEISQLPLRFVPVVGRRVDHGRDPLDAAGLGEVVPDVRSREAFVCGSPGLVSAVARTLSELGVPADRIHHEELQLTA